MSEVQSAPEQLKKQHLQESIWGSTDGFNLLDVQIVVSNTHKAEPARGRHTSSCAWCSSPWCLGWVVHRWPSFLVWSMERCHEGRSASISWALDLDWKFLSLFSWNTNQAYRDGYFILRNRANYGVRRILMTLIAVLFDQHTLISRKVACL